MGYSKAVPFPYLNKRAFRAILLLISFAFSSLVTLPAKRCYRTREQLNMGETKKCRWCKVEKSVSEFYWDRKNSNYLFICRKCDNKRNYENKRKRGHYTSNQFYARKLVYVAKRNGTLKEKPCEVCGELKVDAHHYKGYERENWLDVKWLCPTHHNLVHHPR